MKTITVAQTRRRQQPDSACDGSALIVVVVLLAAIGVLLGSFVSGTSARLARRHAQWREEVAGALAEAGVQSAAAHLAETGGTYSGEDKVSCGDGSYSTSAQRTTAPDVFSVTAIGELRDEHLLLHRVTRAARIRIQDHRITALEYAADANWKAEIP